MTRSQLLRLGATVALAGVTLAACSTPASSTAPSTSTEPASVAPESSAPAESPSEAASSSPEASEAASLAPSGSPEARTVQIQAGDDRFMNAPVDPLVGTVLTFRNVGQQAHEVVVLRRNDDATDTQTFDDLTKVNPADLMKFVTVVGVLAADPGQEATGQIVLDQAGDYAIVDLLAQGTTTAPASPDPMAIPSGIPNIASGLFGTFTVAEPEAS
jgi:hypothetical protein